MTTGRINQIAVDREDDDDDEVAAAFVLARSALQAGSRSFRSFHGNTPTTSIERRVSLPNAFRDRLARPEQDQSVSVYRL